jgi:hypothetical protein
MHKMNAKKCQTVELFSACSRFHGGIHGDDVLFTGFTSYPGPPLDLYTAD